MKKTTALLAFLFMFASCNYSVYYKQAQPAGGRDLNSFPKKFRGQYVTNNNSTLCFLTQTQLNWQGKNDTICGTLSDSLILRKLHRHYLLNVRQNIKYEDDYLWHTYLIKYYRKKKNIQIRIIADDSRFRDHEFFDLTWVTTIITPPGKRYIIDPTPEELEQLIRKNCFRLLYCFLPTEDEKFLHIFAVN